VRQCLTKDPDERMQTAHDVRLQLQWVEEGGALAAVSASHAVTRRWSLVLLAVGLIGLLLGAAITAAVMLSHEGSRVVSFTPRLSSSIRSSAHALRRMGRASFFSAAA